MSYLLVEDGLTVVKISLDLYETASAVMCGIMRQTEVKSRGATFRLAGRPLGLWTETHAAGAEIAVAKYLRKYWAGSNRFSDPDIAPDIEVRWTKHENGRLIVRSEAPNERRYVLVRGALPDYEIVGWILAGDAKQEKYLDNPNQDGECYWVPGDDLRPMSELLC